MGERNRHLIERQILELDVSLIARVPAVQEAAAQRLRARAMTEIEALFDRLAGPDRILRIERVEIDLGELGGADWQDEFESRLVARLTHSLEQATANEQGQVPEPPSGQGTAFEQYLFFLEHGRLPWWGEPPPTDWPRRLLQALAPPQWQALEAVLARDAHARRRLIHAVDDATLASLLSRHAELREVARVFALWRPAHLPQTLYTSWRTQFWLALLEPVTTGGPARGVEIMRRLLQLKVRFAAPSPPASAYPGAAHTTPDLPPPWQDWMAAARRQDDTPLDTSPAGDRHPTPALDVAMPLVQVASPVETSATRPRSPDGQPRPDAQSLGVDRPQAPPEPNDTNAAPTPMPALALGDRPRARDADKRAEADEAIYLNGAGGVILHPFLEELFRGNDLLAIRAFRDEAARARAVRLLAFLTFGDEAAPEYDLLLPKLLCGMAWEESPAPIELTRAERAACDELLRAVLTHWRALKSNSPEWMREQFFLRLAKLERLDLNWRLTVERRAQDVLVDRLPWGLGVVALPWMEGRIFVRWVQ